MNDDNEMTPERMQEQCASIAESLEAKLDEGAIEARKKAAATWLPWVRRKHIEFANAATFASAVAKTVALVVRALPTDHPVDIKLAELKQSMRPTAPGDSPDNKTVDVTVKPKGVTLQ